MTEAFDSENPSNEVMLHYTKELDRTEDKYDLKKLFSRKAGDSSFIQNNNNENVNLSSNQERFGSAQMSVTMSAGSKKK